MPTKTKAQFTVQQLIQFMQKIEDTLYDYDLYGTKENLDLVKDVLPYNIKSIEVPKEFLPNDSKLYLMDRDYLNYLRGEEG